MKKLISEYKICIYCPFCNGHHLDQGKYALKPHKVHLCFHCGRRFRVAKATIGVKQGINDIICSSS